MSDGAVIERLADAAWPAAEGVPLGPWKLRATRGVTQRANSVFTAGTGSVEPRDLDGMIDAAERFYAERLLPSRFHLSPYSVPFDLDAALARRGYAMVCPTEVWTASVAALVKAPAELPVEGDLVSEDSPDQDWFDCAFDEPAAKREVHEEIVRRVAPPRRFVSMLLDGEAVACGMAVSMAGYAGVFCMATRPQWRRRGFGGAVLRELTRWASERHDRWMYLQVLADNHPARSLYRRVGLSPAYSYHYRVKVE